MMAAQNKKNKHLAIQDTKISEGAKLRMINSRVPWFLKKAATQILSTE